MPRTLVACVYLTLLALGIPSPRASADPSWKPSLYAGRSLYPRATRTDTGLAGRISLVRQLKGSVYRVGAEAGYLGLGSEGVFYLDADSPVGDGIIHYDSFHAGPILRIQTTGAQRLQAYGVLGLAPYALKIGWAKRETHIGGSVGAGFYGIAPGMFGVEARWYLIPSGDPYSPSPLSLGSIMAGVNF